MNEIDSVFAQNFKHWDIRLPAEAVAARAGGKIHHAGWTIEYLFGSEEDGEDLDYYATHRMTDDRHVRIHSEGRSEALETPQDFYALPSDADEATRKEAEEDFYAHNRAVYARLRERGFLSCN